MPLFIALLMMATFAVASCLFIRLACSGIYRLVTFHERAALVLVTKNLSTRGAFFAKCCALLLLFAETIFWLSWAFIFFSALAQKIMALA